jgi:hypothetical protein
MKNWFPSLLTFQSNKLECSSLAIIFSLVYCFIIGKDWNDGISLSKLLSGNDIEQNCKYLQTSYMFEL